MRRHLPIAAAMLAVLSGFAFAPSAFAQARPDTRAMTCDQVQAMIRREGAVMMTTGPHTFNRFVSDHRFCGGRFPVVPQMTTVPTRDDNRCRVTRCIDNVTSR